MICRTPETLFSAAVVLGVCLLSSSVRAQNAVAIEVDPSVRRSIAGVSQFDRSRFIVLHATHTGSEWDSPEMQDQFLNDWDVYLGRDVGLASWWFGEVDEDPARPGFPSISHIAELGARHRNNYSQKTGIHQYEVRNDLVTSTHVHPFYPDGSTTRQGWAPADATATGLFLGHFFKEFFGDKDGVHGQPRPKFFEVINEPDWELIEASYAPGNITYQDIWDYHATIAREIRKLNDDVEIGGFCATSMTYGTLDMQYWKDTWESFMKSVGPEMDFVSLHLYDKGWNEGNQYLRVGARVEAQLDLTEQAGYLFGGGVKPMIISEYGAVDPTWHDKPYSPQRDWIINKATIGMLMQFMERPHLIEKAVPFILLKALWWNDPSGQPYAFRLLREDGNGNWVYTDIAKLYEFLSELKGQRVYSRAGDVDIQVDAFVSGNRLYVIANNLEHADVEVTIDPAEFAGGGVTGGWVKHLHAPAGVTVLDEEAFTGQRTSFTIGNQGTIIVAFDYSETVRTQETCEETKYYTTSYLQPITAGAGTSFSINGVALASHGDVSLRLGLVREHGKSLTPTVSVNGTPVDVPSDFRGYDQRWHDNFFGVIEIPVPMSALETNNVVEVNFPDSGGMVTSVTMRVVRFLDREPPTLKIEPVDVTANAGGTVTLSVVAAGSGLQYQWFKDGAPLAGATSASLRLENVSTAEVGSYSVSVSNAYGSVQSSAATVSLSGATAAAPGPALVNISTRGRTGGAAGELIAGFVVTGAGSKDVLIRAVGPSLSQFGITDFLADPVLELVDGGGSQVLVNDDWMDDPSVADGVATVAEQVGAFALNDSSADAVLRVSLPAGSYTAVVRGKGENAGVGMVELYDLDPSSAAGLVNLSTRGQVGMDDASLIAGFVVSGAPGARLLIRGVGPQLGEFGVSDFVVDPTMALNDALSNLLLSNDDWAADSASVAEIQDVVLQVGAFELSLEGRDATLLTTVAPAAYTAVVSAKDNAGGAGLVELYKVEE